jgi:anti-repressor protein
MAEHDAPTPPLGIAGVPMTHDAQGRYSLNALHRASGGQPGKEPAHWLAKQSTQALVTACEGQHPGACLDVVHEGTTADTYAHALLAVSYAGWIAPAFQLKVNQAFLDSQRRPKLPMPLTHSLLETADLLAQFHARHVAMEAMQPEQQAHRDADDRV